MKIRLFLALLGFPLFACSGATTIIYVNQQAPATSQHNGSSWANAYTELRDALQGPATAASVNSAVEIWVAAGTYKPTADTVRSKSFIVPSYTTIRGGFAGTEASAGQRPATGSWTVLSGDIGAADANGITSANVGNILNGTTATPDLSSGADAAGLNDNSYNVITCAGVNNVLLDGLIITGGDANNLGSDHFTAVVSAADLSAMAMPGLDNGLTGAPVVQPNSIVAGGGLFVSNSFTRPAGQTTVSLIHCVFIRNRAYNFGGGMAAFEANLSATSCAFVGNFAGQQGGAFAGINTFSTFASCTFTNNAAGVLGGAVSYTTLPSSKTITSALSLEQQQAAAQSIGTGIALGISGGKYLISKYAGGSGLFDDFNFSEFIDDDNPASEAIGEAAGAGATSEISLALSGLAEGYAIDGLAVTAGNLAGDLAIAFGGNPNSSAYQGYLKFSTFFGEYLTPLGILSQISSAFGGSLGSLLHQSSFEDQQNEYAQGEVSYFNTAPYTVMKDCTFYSNKVWGLGGAVCVNYDNVEFDRCWFMTNGANFSAGALALIGWNTPRVDNCAFSGNRSVQGYSAIMNSIHARSQIINCTLVGNGSGSGGIGGVSVGCELGAQVNLFNSILWGNTNTAHPSDGADLYVATSGNLTGNVLSAYQNAGPGQGDYVATLDLRTTTVQSFSSLPQGIENFELYPWNADDFLIATANQEYQQADSRGFATLAGYCNLGEGIRPGSLTYINGENFYDNNATAPILIGKGGVIPANISSSTYQNYFSAYDYYNYTIGFTGPLPLFSSGTINESNGKDDFFSGPNIFAEVPNAPALRDVFGDGTSSLGMERGCVQVQDLGQPGLGQNNGLAAFGTVFYLRQGAPNNGDGLTWATAFNNFSQIFSSPRAILPLPVWVATGSYPVEISLNQPLQMYGGFTGNETNLNQRNPALHPTYLTGLLETGNDLLLDGFIVQNNNAGGSFGAIYGQADPSAPSPHATLTNCVFFNNTNGEGAAVYWAGLLNLYNCTFISNSTPALYDGGAIFGNEVVAINCYFASNSAGARGGAIFFLDYLEAAGCVFAENNAGYSGSAIFGEGTWNLYNSTFYGNGPLTLGAIGSPSQNNCLFVNDVSEGTPIQNFPGYSSDPMLADPAHNNFQLTASSPAIGAALGGGLPANFPTTDIAGHPRFTSGRLDLGAYQFQGTPLSPPVFTPAQTSVTGGLVNGTWGPIYTFTVAQGTNALPPSLQWQINSGNGTWVNIANGPVYQGATTLQLTIQNPGTNLNGSQFRLIGSAANGASFDLAPITLPGVQRVVYVDGTGGPFRPTVNGSSWATAFVTLPEAFAAAQPGSEIWIRAATYYPARTRHGVPPPPASLSLINGVRILGGFNGTETSDTQRNWKTNRTILTGNIYGPGDDPGLGNYVYYGASYNGINPVPNIFVNNTNVAANAVLDGFILTQASGGAMVNLGASPQIVNCQFTSNTAAAGAAAANTSGANPQFINCIFATNFAQQGALYFNGAVGTLANCLLYDNQCFGNGAAIAAADSSLYLLNSALVSNTAAGICGGLFAQGGTNTLVNSILWANADGQSGFDILGQQLNGGSAIAISYSCLQGSPTTNHNSSYDPAFNFMASNDFHLSPSSPLINTGNATAAITLGTDLDGNSREAGGLVDVGPYQHQITPQGALMVGQLPYSVSVTNFGVYNLTVSGAATSLTGLQWQINAGSGFVPVAGMTSPGYSAVISSNSATLSINLTNVLAQYNSLNGVEYRFVIPSQNITSPPSVLYIRVPIILLVNSQASGPTHNGLTWATAFTNLVQALQSTNQNVQETWVAQGTYPLPNLTVSQPLYGGFTGVETVRSQRNITTHPTILTATNTFLTSVLDGFFVQGSPGQLCAVEVSYASPSIQNCILYGASNLVYVNSGQPIISNCVMSNANVGVYVGLGMPLIAGSTFANGLGCGVYVTNLNSVFSGLFQVATLATVSNSVFSGLPTAICCFGVATHALIVRSTFTSNTASVVDGTESDTVVRDSLFYNNSGVSIYHNFDGNYQTGTTVINCTITGNRQPDGAIAAKYALGGSFSILNSILWNNYSSNWHNALNNTSVLPFAYAADFTNSDVNEISFPDATNYYVNLAWARYFSAQGNLIASFTSNQVANLDLVDKPYEVTVANCCIQGLNFFGGGGDTGSDPLFANAAANNFLPITLSPMVDAGNPGAVIPGELDRAGQSRVFGPAVDIGAYELQVPSAGVIGVAQGPQSMTVTAPGSAIFTAQLSPNSFGSNYTWQINTGSGWASVPSGAPFSPANSGNTATLTISPVDLSMTGWQVRLTAPVVSLITAPATLTVEIQSFSGTVRGAASTTAVLAPGADASTYLWQVNNGSGWVNLTNGAGYNITIAGNTSTLAIPSLGVAQNGNQYRITSANGTFASLPATLTVIIPPQIYVNAAAVGQADGSSWGNAFTRIQDALGVVLPGQQIWVAGGTYQPGAPLELPASAIIYGGFAGNETSAAQRNWVSNPCLLTAAANTAIISNQFLLANAATVLDGFYLIGGNGQPALVNISVSPTVRNCVFTGNTASAVSNFNSPGSFLNCVFSNNMGVASAFYEAGEGAQLTNCLFVNNANTGGGGGAVCISNLVGQGQFTACQFISNSASGNGGAVLTSFLSGSQATFSRSAMSNNISAANGGAVFGSGPGTVELDWTILSGNAAVNGGGLYGYTNLGNGMLESCLIVRNNAVNQGGGVDSERLHSGSAVTVVNCTVADNSVGGLGGGLYLAEGPSAYNSIFWNNISAQGGTTELQQIYDLDYLTARATLQNLSFYIYYLGIESCTIQGLQIYHSTPLGNGFNVELGDGNFALDPAFVNSSAGNYQLLSSSPAINAANGAYLAINGPDLAGNPRYFGPLIQLAPFQYAIDLGPYEVQSAPTIPLSGATLPVSKITCGGDDVTFTLSATNSVNISNFIWTINTGAGFVAVDPSSTNFIVIQTPTSTSLRVVQPSPSLNGAQFQLVIPGYPYATPPVTLTVSGYPQIVYVNVAATGTNDGSSWANAFTNLADALGGNSCAQVWVAQGTYPIPVVSNTPISFRLRQFLDLRGGFAGVETNLSQRDYAHHPTVLLASGGQSVIFDDGTATTIDATAVLDGFVLTGATTAPALFNVDASPTIRNCVFTNNGSRGVENLGLVTGSSGVFNNCQFVNGAGGLVNIFSAPVIADCVFSGNKAAGFGAGIENEQGSPVINNCSFAKNSAVLGGAFYNNTTNAGPTLNDNTFTGNSATEGGAIFNTPGSALVLRDALAAKNSAAIEGGAIFDAGLLTALNCTMADNAAGYAAGGIWVDSGSALAATNCIIWDNTVNTPGITQELQQIDGFSRPALLNAVASTLVQGAPNSSDPFFVGESSGNYRLANGSPAINAGNSIVNFAGELDLDGNARVVGSRVDLGAYEYQLTASSAVAVGQFPQSVSTCASNTVVFTVSAPAASGFTYLWQENNGLGFTTITAGGNYFISSSHGVGTLTIPSAPLALDGSAYQVVLQGASLSITSAVFTLSVAPRSVIYVNRQAAPGGNGSSWSQAYVNLADAFGQGNCSDIWVAAGIYTPTNDTTGVAVTLAMQEGMRVFGGFAGTETSLSQRNPSAHSTILQAAAGSPALEFVGTGTPIDNSTLCDGWTITGGSTAPAVLVSGAAPLIQNCQFIANSGGALLCQGAAAPALVNCVFSQNTGAPAVSTQGASPVFTNCVFAGNQANGAGGAAINAQANSAVTLSTCVVSNNIASVVGGGLLINQSTAMLISSLLVNNSAASGGAIGGVNATLFLLNDTIAQNSAAVTGGVLLTGAAYVTNTILWNNGATESAQLSGNALVGYSCIQGLSQFAGNNNIPYDPLFVSPSAGNFAEQNGSPCIDAGNLAAAAAATDLAGQPRLNGNFIDIGAYQSATVGVAIQITQQPASQAACAGSPVSFAVSGPPNFGSEFTWQVNTGSGFAPLTAAPPYQIIVGNSNSTLVIASPTVGMSSYQFRAQISTLSYYSAVATLTVLPQNIIYVSKTAAGSGTGTSWANAFASLDSALAIASPCDQVWVARGAYASSQPGGFAVPPGADVYGGFAGTETALSQRNAAGAPTLLTDSGQTNVIEALAGGAGTRPSLIDGFTITGVHGAGLTVSAGNPVVQNCAFVSNAFAALSISGGAPLVQNCVFTNNLAGAVDNVGGGQATITNCLFQGNQNPAGQGGAIYNAGASLSVYRSLFISNSAAVGGAVAQSANSPFVLLDHSTFAGNAAAGDGGAVYNGENGNMSVVNCLFYSNSAAHGGGLANYSQMAVLNSTLAENSASVAGGAAYGAEGLGTITNSILWGNVITAQPGLDPFAAQWQGSLAVGFSIVQSASLHEAGPGNLSFDPLFTNAAAGNFRLLPESPAIGAGSLSAAQPIVSDLDFRPRAVNTQVDLGAYEIGLAPALHPINMITEPVSQTACAGQATAAFSAVGLTNTSLQWVVNGGAGWQAVSGPLYFANVVSNGAIATYTLVITNLTLALNGYQYALTDGQSFLSPPARLTVLTPAVIYVNASASGGDGHSWSSAFNNLSTALASVQMCDSVLWVAGGTYAPSTNDPNAAFVVPSVRGGVQILGGFAGTETAVNQRNPQAHSAILSGAAAGSAVIVSLSGTSGIIDSNTILDGLVIQGGQTGVDVVAASPVIQNCLIQSNTASGMIVSDGSPLLTNVWFLANTGTTGGALNLVSNTFGCAPLLVNCVFRGNTAVTGGAIAGLNVNPTIVNGLVSGNSASATGGGLSFAGGAPMIINSTIADNFANSASGGGVSGGTAQVVNSIIWGNASAGLNLEASQISGAPTVISSCVQGLNQFAGNGNIGFDPLFQSAINPGPTSAVTGDFHLSASSPALRNGETAAVAAFATDLDGNPRLTGGQVDLGAYEFQGAPGTPLIITNLVAPVTGFAANPLALHANAAGAGITYQWQINSNGQGWVNLAGGAGYGGTTTSILTISNLTASLAGSTFRVTVTDQNGVSSTSAPQFLNILPSVYYLNAATTTPGNGQSWAAPFQSLSIALAHMVYGPANLQLWVAAGDYTNATIIVPDNLAILGGFNGTEMSPAQRNIAQAPTLLAGAGNPLFVAVNLTNATLDGFIIDNSALCVSNSGGFLTLANCAFSNNTQVLAALNGGGTVLNGCQMTGNIASASSLINFSGASGTLTNCVFSGNLGSVVEITNGNLAVSGCVFSNNPNTVLYSGTQAAAQIQGSSFVNNGVGIYADSQSEPTVANCVFTANIHGIVFNNVYPYIDFAFYPGAYSNLVGWVDQCQFISNRDSALCSFASQTFVSRSVFKGNRTVGSGGALLVTDGIPAVVDSIFTGNYAGQSGGAIYLGESYGGQLTMNNCTIAANGSAGPGAGIYVVGDYHANLDLGNCILWDNYGPDTAGAVGFSASAQVNATELGNFGPQFDFYYTDIENPSPYPYVFGVVGQLSLNPVFVQPLAGGGMNAPTAAGNYQVGSDSPVVGAGNSGYVNVGGYFGLNVTTDLAGQPRSNPNGGSVDMGAYQFQGALNPAPLTILTNPASLTYNPVIQSGNFMSIAVTGANLTYQWFADYLTGRGYVALSDGTNYTGTTTASLQILALPPGISNANFLVEITSANGGGTLISSSASVTVNQPVWFVNASAPGGGDGKSWATAFSDLPTAIGNPHLTDGGSQIWVAAGTYSGTLNLPNGVALVGGFSGNETALTQRNPASHPTILAGINSSDFIYTYGSPVDGFIFNGLLLVLDPIPPSVSGFASVANCSFFQEGVQYSSGTGVYAPTLITNCQFDLGAAISYPQYATILNCLFTNYSGAGINCLASNDVESCVFAGAPSAGRGPGGNLVTGPDGNLYGVTVSSVLFRLSTNGSITPLSLGNATPGFNGGPPRLSGYLTVGRDGNIYGFANYPGQFSGVVQVGINGQITPFGPPLSESLNPQGPLAQGNDGNFYGICYRSLNGQYQLIKATSAGATVLTTLQSPFNGGPSGVMVRGTDGNFYSPEAGGGLSSVGAILQINPSGATSLFYQFPATTQGDPEALVLGPDGNFYGAATGLIGGAGSPIPKHGIIFRLTPGGTFSTIYTFTNGNDGSIPKGLTFGSDGVLYGVTSTGSFAGAGTVFKLTTSGQLTVLSDFTNDGVNFNGQAIDGITPEPYLAQGGDGAFYGANQYGGTANAGTLFSVNSSGQFRLLESFSGTDLSSSGVFDSGGGNTFKQCVFTANILGLNVSYVSFGDQVINCSITNNFGGGIQYHGEGDSLLVDHCAITGNGGTGIGVRGADLHVYESLIAGNASSLQAGAIDASGDFVSIFDSTIAGNLSATLAGGVADPAGTVQIYNSIAWYNQGVDGFTASDEMETNATLQYGYNDIQGVSLASAYSGSNDVSFDPIFVHAILPAAAPSVAGDYHLLPYSPLLALGLPAVAIGTNDLDSQARLFDNTIDPGTYEYLGLPSSTTIVQTPTNTTVQVGHAIQLSVGVNHPLSGYQWYFNGGPITNATNAVLLIPNANCASAGTYDVAVSNLFTSVPIVVSIVDTNLPAFTQNVIAQTNSILPGGALALSVAMSANCNPSSFQWYFNGTNALPAQNFPSLTITNLDPTNSGAYTVVVADVNGSVTSRVSVLNVPLQPAIITSFVLPPFNKQLYNEGYSRSYLLTFTGSGSSFTVQYSTDLVHWANSFLPVTKISNGVFQCQPSSGASQPQMFYRVISH